MLDIDPDIEVEGARRARDFRDEHDLGSGPIADVAALAERWFAAGVAYLQFPDFLDAHTYVDPVSRKTLIAIATSANPERQRFSIAHELGHLVTGTLATEFESAGERTRDELRAHAFARHLLLPLDGLVSIIGEPGAKVPTLRDLSDAVSYFRVSGAVASIQLWLGGHIDEALATSWYSIEANFLADRFGWSDERAIHVEEAQTPRPAQGFFANAIEGYLDQALSVETLAQVHGSIGVHELRKRLADTPAQLAEAPSLSLDDL